MRSVLFALFLSLASLAQAAPLPDLRGDAEATGRIEKMLGRMGGRERWADAKSIYIHYRQLSSRQRAGDGGERAWRDISKPAERLELWRTDYEGRTQNWGHVFNEHNGWVRGAEGLRDYTAEEIGRITNFWRRDFYTMFHRMAAGDPALSYRFTSPNRIDVSEGGKEIGWWDIDRGGMLLRWGAQDYDGDELSYVYGPFKQYGDIAFPAWGASSDATFRFEYVEFLVSPKALPDAVFLDASKQPPAELRLR